MKTRILSIISSDAVRQRFDRLSGTPNSDVKSVSPTADVWTGLVRETFDLLITTRSDLPQPLDEFVDSLSVLPSRPQVIIVTADPDPAEHARVIAAGGLAAVYTRLPDRVLKATLAALLRRVRAVQELWSVEDAGDSDPALSDFVTESPAMTELMAMAERVASADSSVLIGGETGVGKEWLARAIHMRSARSVAPFVAVNCAALPEGLFESELFGHVEGAFTGAIGVRRGYFELAHQGTLFLDEIGELPTSLQAKLLRVLQDGEVWPVGGEAPIQLDTRIIAATNRDLERSIKLKEFRRDLFYRIGVVALTVPPLRERREDIESLVMGYLERFAIELKRPIRSIEPDALEALLQYSWPGNVRELINVMERSVLLSDSTSLRLGDLPLGLRVKVDAALQVMSVGPSQALDAFDDEWLTEPLAAVTKRVSRRIEREYLEKVLRLTGGRVSETAAKAGVSKRTLFTKMRDLDLRKEDYRQPRRASTYRN